MNMIKCVSLNTYHFVFLSVEDKESKTGRKRKTFPGKYIITV